MRNRQRLLTHNRSHCGTVQMGYSATWILCVFTNDVCHYFCDHSSFYLISMIAKTDLKLTINDWQFGSSLKRFVFLFMIPLLCPGNECMRCFLFVYKLGMWLSMDAMLRNVLKYLVGYFSSRCQQRRNSHAFEIWFPMHIHWSLNSKIGFKSQPVFGLATVVLLVFWYLFLHWGDANGTWGNRIYCMHFIGLNVWNTIYDIAHEKWIHSIAQFS